MVWILGITRRGGAWSPVDYRYFNMERVKVLVDNLRVDR
jgi:hypothetical protein